MGELGELGAFQHYDYKWKVRHEVAQEMRVGPSKPSCRRRLQTTLSCIGKEPMW